MKIKNLRKNVFFSSFAAFALLFLQSNFSLAQSTIVSALPQGANTVNGTTNFNYAGNNLNVTASDKSIINWNSYNIGQINTVNYIQPNASSVVLNRVVGVDPSSIYGNLNANGRVFIVNPNGIFFGAGSQVNVNGLLASTLDISNDDFLAGKYNFSCNANPSSIINQGNIHISNGGYVLLLSNAVNNSGLIEAKLGHVLLAAGEKMTVALDDDSDISVTIANPANYSNVSNAVQNSGSIIADGGSILLNSKVLNGIFDNAINNSGVLQANSLVNDNGSIELVANGGNIVVSSGALISAKASGADGQGGNISINSTNDIKVAKGAVLDISGGSNSGNGGNIDFIAQGNLDFQGAVNGYAANGYDMGTVNLDPATASISGVYNADTTVYATGDITIDGNTLIGSGVTLNIFADHNSVSNTDWAAGTGGISNLGNYTITEFVGGTGTVNLKAGLGGIGSLANPILLNGINAFSAVIDPSAASGNIAVTNSAAVPLNMTSEGVTTPNGNIYINSGNNLYVGSVNAGSSGSVFLTTTNGSVFDDSNDSTWITAKNISIISALDVGGSLLAPPALDPRFLDIDASVSNLSINAPNGSIYLNIVNGSLSTSQLSLSDISPTGTGVVSVSSGDLNVNSGFLNGVNLNRVFLGANGNINLSNNISINAGSGVPDIVLFATGNINLAQGGDTTISAPGGNIIIDTILDGTNSNGGISTSGANTVHFNTANLFLASSQGINITSDTTANSSMNISANNNVSGGININNTGNLNIADGSSLGSDFADGISNTATAVHNDNVVLSSDSNVNVNAGISTGAGDVTINANGNVLLNAPISTSGLGGNGDVAINAGNTLTLAEDLNAGTGTVTLNTTSGSINQSAGALTAGILNVSNTTGATTLNDSGNQINTLGLIDAAGQTFSLTNAQSLTESGSITASNILLEGNGTFNLNGSNNAGILAANITGGDFTFSNNGALAVGSVNGTDGVTDLNNNITLNSGNTLTLAQSMNAGFGIISLNAAAGGISQTIGGLTSGGLLVTGTGTDTLQSSTNSNGTIAANVNGSFSYTDANALNVGTVNGTSGITTNSNDVILNTGNTLTLSQDVNAGTGTILLLTTAGGANQTGGALTSGGLRLNGTGDYTLNSASNSNGSIQADINGALSYTDANALTVGTVSGITTNNNPVTLNVGDSLTIANDINTGTGTLSLNAANGVTETTGAVIDGGLSLTGTGTFTLNNTNNNSGAVAANVNGSISYIDSGINVSTVNGVNGVTASGNINFEALTSDINLNASTASTGGAVNLTSDNGSINGSAGSTVTANADSVFTTLNGTIGLTNSVDVNVTGNLKLDIESQTGGHSGVLTGIVTGIGSIPQVYPGVYVPSLNPPGDVYFNSIKIWPIFNNPPAPNNNPPSNGPGPILFFTQFSTGLNNHFVFPTKESLAYIQVNPFDPSTSSTQTGGAGLFLYHPLTDVDSGAFTQEFQLDQGAYDFIDGEILKKGR